MKFNFDIHFLGGDTIKGKALILGGVVFLTLVIAAAYGFNSSDSQSQVSNDSKQDDDGNDSQQKDITSEEAKAIAKKHIDTPNATVGEVETVKIAGKENKVVPVIQNGERVGEINIDPETGEVTGGAGGAPS